MRNKCINENGDGRIKEINKRPNKEINKWIQNDRKKGTNKGAGS
jgi:hypothetical protein